MQQIISTRSSKIALCENLDPRKFSAVQYVKSFFRSLIFCPNCEERPCCIPHCLLLPVINRDWGGETSHQGEVWNPLLHHIRHPGGLVCVVLSCVYLWSDISSLGVSHIVVHSQVRYLKIIEKSGYQALPWVRYITQNGGMTSFPSILCLSLHSQLVCMACC